MEWPSSWFSRGQRGKAWARGANLPLLAKPVNLAARLGKLSRPSDISLPQWSPGERNRRQGDGLASLCLLLAEDRAVG